MKENPYTSHKGAASVQPAARRRTTGATLGTEDASGAFSQNDSSEEYDNEWDVGVGNLVIDLDADLAKTKWNNNNGSEGKSPSPASSPTKPSAKMSGVEHQVSVDKGLKMKIKRKNIGAKNDAKHEIVKEAKGSNSNNSVTDAPVNNSPMDKAKHSGTGEKGTKGRGVNKKAKERAAKQCSEPLANGGAFLMPASGGPPAPVSQTGPCPQGAGVAGGMSSSAILSVELDRISGPFNVKKEVGGPAHDPYEFNAKWEDKPPSFFKKVKVEKTETASSPIVPMMQDVGVETTSVGVVTEPDCLGPCEPGTSVTLEGIVWQETENGMLVVNVTWRGKTYVGTLLDATKHDWGSPRFTCDSPTSDLEVQTPKGRAKRGRAAAQTPLNDMSNYGDRKLRKSRRCSAGNFQAPPSPARSDVSTGVKRKGRPYDLDASNGDAPKASKRSRSNSRSTPTGNSDSSTYIECPEPNCNKKYKHINGLRYHQNHAHQSSSLTPEDNNTDEPKEMESEDSSPQSPSAASSKPEKPSSRSQVKSKKNSVAQAEEDTTTGPEAAPVRPSPKKRGSGESHNSGQDNKSGEVKSKAVKEEVKEEKKPVAVPVVPSTSVDTKTSAAAQVFQISGAPMGCLNASTTVVSATPVVGTVAPAAPAAVASPATHIATGTTVTVPVAVTSAGLMAVQDIKEEKPKKGKGEKGDKSRGKGNVSTARPIMPAPTPQLAVAHTTLTTVTTHAQISPISPTTSQLKPIQPKPTIMGDPPAINPALQGLKDKKPKKKKVPTATLR